MPVTLRSVFTSAMATRSKARPTSCSTRCPTFGCAKICRRFSNFALRAAHLTLWRHLIRCGTSFSLAPFYERHHSPIFSASFGARDRIFLFVRLFASRLCSGRIGGHRTSDDAGGIQSRRFGKALTPGARETQRLAPRRPRESDEKGG